jgi:hypothetical protein
MTLVVPPPLVPTVLGKAAPSPPQQAQVLAGALAQAVQQQARSAAGRTETPQAVRRISRVAPASPTQEKRLPDAPTAARGGRLDVSA